MMFQLVCIFYNEDAQIKWSARVVVDVFGGADPRAGTGARASPPPPDRDIPFSCAGTQPGSASAAESRDRGPARPDASRRGSTGRHLENIPLLIYNALFRWLWGRLLVEVAGSSLRWKDD